MIRQLLTVSLLFSCVCSNFIFAQQTRSLRETIFTIDSLYGAGSYLSAEVEARRLLEFANLNDTSAAEIHKYIAFSLIAQGKSELAKERFALLLSILPAYSLDPVLTSPKILVIFNEARQAFLSSKKSGQGSILTTRETTRPPVSYRAILFPGWEQLYTGRKISGTLFFGLGIATLGSGITFEYLRSGARQEYLTENNPSAIDEKYSTYNRYYKAEIASFVAFVITYIVSEIDVFNESNNPSLTLQSSNHPGGYTGVSVTVKF
jgi:hypothetical protein